MNYYNTFISIAPDCPATHSTVPPVKKAGRTKPAIEYDLLSNNPYTLTQEDLLFEVHVQHKSIPEEEMITQGDRLREGFFGKSHACFRASMLGKKYGWGIHFNAEGKAALIPLESPEYQRFVNGEIENVKILKAMRNKREVK
ncbi:DUF6157 family protein [Paenisporosarcina indica]|uniref:DUF6157 family protein n=1 Tax=Paenisporosarcina indica TaxID=650093 RepID=UPI00094F74F9|nr:DUF6157 family protein [Paenisporosarcina indica]